jgi:predicted dehydrogenase/threonine dehydrogenase-like Zn-dependent dehydrogenase
LRQVAQNYKSGELLVLDVPAPACQPGGVLVRSRYSLISTGTEMMKVGEAKLSLLGKARARPDQLRKVIDTATQLGPAEAYTRAVNKLDSYTPLGYSCSGVVVAVGAGAEQFSVGQLVACAGNEYALHAEVNWVPVNLCVPVADDVPPQHAAFATVGAIAMHGVRRAEVQLGETACVIGLGLVGQLAVQLLLASGVRVVGFDVVDERCRLAEAAGATACARPDHDGIERVESVVRELTNRVGADHIFIAAGGASNDPVHIAARIARDRARVVDIGKTSLDLPWNEYYEKELDVRFSRSYGPGRYDDRYELEGIDYPAGYVRWTERRNLGCFIDLVERGALRIELLVSGTFPVDDAPDVYARLADHSLAGIGFLFEYPEVIAASEPVDRPPRPTAPPPSLMLGPVSRPLRVGFVGAGNYATSMLLPHLERDERVELTRVATSKSLSAVNAQRKFGFRYASTGEDSVLDEEDVDAVFIATRHHSHAELVCRALERGKAVFVEKPLALSTDELDRVLATVEATGNDRLMVGFNRRFAPLFGAMKARFGDATSPGSARYVINAGRLDRSSWYLNEGFEGSRFVGEGGHFIDTLSWWFAARPVEVYAVDGGNAGDVHATVLFDDGSVGTIAYVTTGNPRVPKEAFDASAGGRSARLDNFRAATVWAGRRRRTDRSRMHVDKGQRAELDAFVRAVQGGGPMPISLAALDATTRATLAVADSLCKGQPVGC